MKLRRAVDFYKQLTLSERAAIGFAVLNVPLTVYKLYNEAKHRPVPGRPVGFQFEVRDKSV